MDVSTPAFAPEPDAAIIALISPDARLLPQVEFARRVRWNGLDPGPPQPSFITLQRLLI